MARETKKDDTSRVDRRKFFSLFGGATTAALVVPLTGEAEAAESKADQVKARYQPNSADVKNFYRVNRY